MKMSVRGVAVSYHPHSIQDSAQLTCSGILFNDRWVLTHGCLLSPILMATNQRNWSTISNVFKSPSQNEMSNFSVLMENPPVPTQASATSYDSSPQTNWKNESIIMPRCKNSSSFISSGTEDAVEREDIHSIFPYDRPAAVPRSEVIQVSMKHEVKRARVKSVWKCPLVSEAVTTLMSSWTFGDGDKYDVLNQESQDGEVLLPIFVILELVDSTAETPDEAVKTMLSCMKPLGFPMRGHNVVTESTPFASKFFLNSLSEGIVSNVMGPRDCLLLTDIRSAPGCEGGPIFSTKYSKERCLVGMVVCSITWIQGEWVGYTLGVHLQPVLQQLYNTITHQSILQLSAPQQNNLAKVDNAVVMIRCGVHRGTGIVLSGKKGIIITCSHVVRTMGSRSVTVHWKSHTFPAEVVYRTPDGVAYDVAVVRITGNSGLKQLSFATQPPIKGEAVVAVGFRMLTDRDNPTGHATVTRGNVSRIVPAFIQTTCCVQSGMSGGAILRQSGQVMAMIVYNIIADSKALYPHYNLSIPAAILAAPLNAFIDTNDYRALYALESQDPDVQKLWKLQFITNKL